MELREAYVIDVYPAFHAQFRDFPAESLYFQRADRPVRTSLTTEYRHECGYVVVDVVPSLVL